MSARTLRNLTAALLAAVSLYGASTARAADFLPPPLPDPPLTIIRGACPGWADTPLACYTSGTVYLSPLAEGDRFVLYHEFGHAQDERLLDAGERKKFMRLSRLPAGVWRTGSATDRDTGVEWFADAYAHCAGGDAPGWWSSTTSYSPSDALNATICRFIRRALTN